MKKLFFIFLTLALALNFAGCADDDTPPPASGPDGGDDPLADYTAADIEYDGQTIKGYSLAQFVTEAEIEAILGAGVDCRDLYLYRVIASDGWNPADDRDSDDLTWTQFSSGYLLEKLYDAKVYYPSDDIATNYDVKNAKDSNLYRKIDVIKDADESEATPEIISFEMGALDVTDDMKYWNNKKEEAKTGKGISLVLLLSDYVIDEEVDKEGYSYKINLADGYTSDLENGLGENTISWAGIQNAYYVFEEDGEVKDKIVTLGDNYDDGTNNLPEQKYKSMKFPESVEFVDNTAGDDNPIGDNDEEAAAPERAATVSPDINFLFPEQ